MKVLGAVQKNGSDAFNEDPETSLAADAHIKADNVMLNAGSASAASARVGVTPQRYSRSGVLVAALSFVLYMWFIPQYIVNYVKDLTARGGRA